MSTYCFTEEETRAFMTINHFYPAALPAEKETVIFVRPPDQPIRRLKIQRATVPDAGGNPMFLVQVTPTNPT